MELWNILHIFAHIGDMHIQKSREVKDLCLIDEAENKCPKWHIVVLIKVLTLDYCKAILNQGERTYSTDEVRIMREFLYQVAGIEMENNEDKTERR